MIANTYITFIPKEFETFNGRRYNLIAREVSDIDRRAIFKTWIPPEVIPKVVEHLRRHGFVEAFPSTYQGEKYSLSKRLNEVWEHHMRIFDDGFIESHVEVCRDYLEHLGEKRAYVVYEAFEYYRDVYNRFHLFYSPTGEWVKAVYSNFRLELPPPSTLTPWKPIIGGLAVLGTIVILTYYLDKRG